MTGTPADGLDAPPPQFTHETFVEAWREGRIRIDIDPTAATRLVSARLLLPFVTIAVVGLGIGLVLWGWLWTGLTVGGTGIVVARLVRRSAPGFLLLRMADDPALYAAALDSGALRCSWSNRDN